VDQPHAAAGIAAVSGASGPNVFDGLQVLNNTIVSTGSGGFLSTAFGSTYSVGIAALANGGRLRADGQNRRQYNHSLRKRSRRSAPRPSGLTKRTGRSAARWPMMETPWPGRMKTFSTLSRGAQRRSENNTFDGVGVTITEPNADAPTTIEDNQFQPQFGGVDDATLEIKHNYNSTSPVMIEGNTSPWSATASEC